ncbi:MAG: hypothetical protein ABI863_19860 [Ginsengibacter sp.]
MKYNIRTENTIIRKRDFDRRSEPDRNIVEGIIASSHLRIIKSTITEGMPNRKPFYNQYCEFGNEEYCLILL